MKDLSCVSSGNSCEREIDVSTAKRARNLEKESPEVCNGQSLTMAINLREVSLNMNVASEG